MNDEYVIALSTFPAGADTARAAHTLVDLRLDHPSLEENFLSFYDRNGKSAAAPREVSA